MIELMTAMFVTLSSGETKICQVQVVNRVVNAANSICVTAESNGRWVSEGSDALRQIERMYRTDTDGMIEGFARQTPNDEYIQVDSHSASFER